MSGGQYNPIFRFSGWWHQNSPKKTDLVLFCFFMLHNKFFYSCAKFYTSSTKITDFIKGGTMCWKYQPFTPDLGFMVDYLLRKWWNIMFSANEVRKLTFWCACDINRHVHGDLLSFLHDIDGKLWFLPPDFGLKGPL